jgi:type VI secretion system VasD/TssJ family lipoprotein
MPTFFSPVKKSKYIARTSWYGLLIALVLAGCGPKGATQAPKAIVVTVEAAPDLNKCGARDPRALNCRVLFVTDVSPIKAVSLTQLWGNEKLVFESKLLDTKDFSVTPADTLKGEPMLPPPGTTHVLIVGNFACAKPDGWYAEREIKKAKKLNLIAGADSLAVR